MFFCTNLRAGGTAAVSAAHLKREYMKNKVAELGISSLEQHPHQRRRLRTAATRAGYRGVSRASVRFMDEKTSTKLSEHLRHGRVVDA
jgi:hypothetical protein